MRRVLRSAAIVPLVLVAAVASGTAGSAVQTAPEPEPARVVVLSPTATVELQQEVSPFAVSALAGYLDAEALTVETRNVDGSTAAIQALVSGDASIALAGAEATIAAVDKGVPIKIVGALTVNFPYYIATLSDSGIAEVGDLAGKKIGVVSLSSASYPFARGVVEAGGLDAENDVEYIPLGGVATAVTALEGGEVDALAYYTRAYAVIENQGIELSYLPNPPMFDELFSVVIVTTDDMLANNPDVVARYGRAVYKALLFSAVNPQASVEMAYEYFPVLVRDGSEPADQIDDDVRSFGAYLLSVLPLDTVEAGDRTNWGQVPEDLVEYVSTDYVWGALEDSRLDAVQQFAITTGSITEPLELSAFWDPSLIEAMNDWDRAEVVADATNWSN